MGERRKHRGLCGCMFVFAAILIKLELRFVIDLKCFTCLVCFLQASIASLDVSAVATYYTFGVRLPILIALF